MGVGFAYHDFSGFMLDVRGTYRADVTNSNLVFDPATGRFADLSSWEASAALGYEF